MHHEQWLQNIANALVALLHFYSPIFSFLNTKIYLTRIYKAQQINYITRLDITTNKAHIYIMCNNTRNLKRIYFKERNSKLEDYIKHTIWGKAETSLPVAQGIHLVTTPTHGGYVLSKDRIKVLKFKFPLATPHAGDERYWEEDCDWVYVAMAFPQHFDDDLVQNACRQYQNSIIADGVLHKSTKGEE